VLDVTVTGGVGWATVEGTEEDDVEVGRGVIAVPSWDASPSWAPCVSSHDGVAENEGDGGRLDKAVVEGVGVPARKEWFWEGRGALDGSGRITRNSLFSIPIVRGWLANRLPCVYIFVLVASSHAPSRQYIVPICPQKYAW
jgi:hypothetical protein